MIHSVILISIVRLHSLDNISNSKDVPFDNTAHATLSAVEVNVGIICTCLRPLLASMKPKYFSAVGEDKKVRTFDIEQPGHGRKHSYYNTVKDKNQGRNARPLVFHLSHKPAVSNGSKKLFSATDTTLPFHGQRLEPISHYRSASNASVKNIPTPLRPELRFQGRMNPLRMSPANVFSPPCPVQLSSMSSLVPKSYTRNPNDPNTSNFSPSSLPQTSGSGKPLPITPFPVFLVG